MTSYVYRNGQVIEKHLAEPLVQADAAPHVISDIQPELRHMGTGKVTDSKSEFRKMTKASGCIEVGNDMPPPRKPAKLDRRERAEDIRKAIYDLQNGKS